MSQEMGSIFGFVYCVHSFIFAFFFCSTCISQWVHLFIARSTNFFLTLCLYMSFMPTNSPSLVRNLSYLLIAFGSESGASAVRIEDIYVGGLSFPGISTDSTAARKVRRFFVRMDSSNSRSLQILPNCMLYEIPWRKNPIASNILPTASNDKWSPRLRISFDSANSHLSFFHIRLFVLDSERARSSEW